jgi:predicted esterase YcpF (UPF0227 family)
MAQTVARKAEKLAEEAAEILPAEVGEHLENMRDGLEELDDTVRSTVREHPVLTLCGAMLGGYLIGRLIAKR